MDDLEYLQDEFETLSELGWPDEMEIYPERGFEILDIAGGDDA